MTPAALERLLDEATPDGTFGGSRPAGAPSRPRHAVTPAEAAAHYERLEAACREIAGRPASRRPARPARHLRAVPDTGSAA